MVQLGVIKRDISDCLRHLASKYRVVTLLGPRQAGKTTLIRDLFADYAYANLEDPETRELASLDPKSFLARYPQPLIIDEVQRVPDLLSVIQTVVDRSPEKKGQFILSGSHQPVLRETVSQSLAGRTVLLFLYPLTIDELRSSSALVSDWTAGDYIYRGRLPEIQAASLDPTLTYASYYQTYVERDVRQLIKVKDQVQFERFLKLIAGRVGQLLNLSSIANDVGVSSTTLRDWLSILEASFIVFQLPPYFENLGKRLVKTPKLYFVDCGLAAYLLGLRSAEQVERDPLYGNLFENLVVSDIRSRYLNRGETPDLYFYRDSSNREIDLIVKNGRDLTPIEIKSSMTFHQGLIKNLVFFSNRVQKTVGNLVFCGESGPVTGEAEAHHFTEIPNF